MGSCLAQVSAANHNLPPNRERSIEDIKHGRVKTFDSVDDMFESLGIERTKISTTK